MNWPIAIIDTNVVVSGLIGADAQSPTCRVLDAMLDGSLTFLLSPALLDEYQEVLSRPSIVKLHGLSTEETDRILSELAVHALWREPVETLAAPDRDDDHLWALLKAAKAAVLVTGDRLLLENPPDFASVLSPRSFLELGSGRAGT